MSSEVSPPKTIDVGDEYSVIECPRCETLVNVIASWKDAPTGEMIVEYKEEYGTFSHAGRRGGVPEIRTCSVCDGTAQVKVSTPPPLDICTRCLGTGRVTDRSPRLEILDQIESIKQNQKQETSDISLFEGVKIGFEEVKSGKIRITQFLLRLLVEVLGLLNIARTKSESEILELRKKLPDEDTRLHRFSNCPKCQGTGVNEENAAVSSEVLIECRRCQGTGRMPVHYEPSMSSTWEDGCEVCDGQGTLELASTPPFNTCSRCDGSGCVEERAATGMAEPPMNVLTCPSCDGMGFIPTDSVNLSRSG